MNMILKAERKCEEHFDSDTVISYLSDLTSIIVEELLN